MSQKLRHTEARHDALRAAADGRLSYRSGRALGSGSFWTHLPGMPEDEKTTTSRLTATATALIATGHLRHQHPGVPHRSGAVEVTKLGRETLDRFDQIVAARNANA